VPWLTGAPCGLGLPAGERLVALLGVAMTQTAQPGQAGIGGMTLVHAQLLAVAAMVWNHGTTAGQPVRALKRRPLRRRAHGYGACLAALGPAVLEHQVLAPVREARPELDGLFAPQTKGVTIIPSSE